jgi:hypothetical protein
MAAPNPHLQKIMQFAAEFAKTDETIRKIVSLSNMQHLNVVRQYAAVLVCTCNPEPSPTPDFWQTVRQNAEPIWKRLAMDGPLDLGFMIGAAACFDGFQLTKGERRYVRIEEKDFERYAPWVICWPLAP